MYCDTLHCIVLCCVVFVLCLQRPGEVDTSTFVRQSFVPAGHSFTSDHLASPKLKNTLGSQSDTWHCIVLCCVVLCLCLCLCCVVLDWIGLYSTSCQELELLFALYWCRRGESEGAGLGEVPVSVGPN